MKTGSTPPFRTLLDFYDQSITLLVSLIGYYSPIARVVQSLRGLLKFSFVPGNWRTLFISENSQEICLSLMHSSGEVQDPFSILLRKTKVLPASSSIFYCFSIFLPLLSNWILISLKCIHVCI